MSFWENFLVTPIEKGIAVAVVALVALAIWVGWRAEADWQQFVRDHQCHVIGHVSGSTGVGPSFGVNGGSGIAVVTIPGKTGWLCNNGQQYWR